MKIHNSFVFKKIRSKNIDQFFFEKKSDLRIQINFFFKIRSENTDQFCFEKKIRFENIDQYCFGKKKSNLKIQISFVLIVITYFEVKEKELK